MTKDYGLAGLRLGYLVAHPSAITAVKRLQPPWSVSSAAQAAGIAALADLHFLPRMLAVMRAGKTVLVEGLRGLGLEVLEGSANFVLVEVGDAPAVRHELLRKGCAVRDCTSFGLPAHVRIGVRRPEECVRLIEAFSALLQERAAEAAAPSAG
ncbi:MAG: aminotransferase class I/II-fold pyridoxal phosphate-dependent enzyme, partial [Dehalococcoidia bacterium]